MQCTLNPDTLRALYLKFWKYMILTQDILCLGAKCRKNTNSSGLVNATFIMLHVMLLIMNHRIIFVFRLNNGVWGNKVIRCLVEKTWNQNTNSSLITPNQEEQLEVVYISIGKARNVCERTGHLCQLGRNCLWTKSYDWIWKIGWEFTLLKYGWGLKLRQMKTWPAGGDYFINHYLVYFKIQ